MSRATLEAAVEAGVLIVLDTSAVLAYLDGSEVASPAAAYVFDELIWSGRDRGLVSPITVTETLVRPFRSGSSVAIGTADTFLGSFPNLSIAPVDYAVGREAARVRALSGLPTADAIIIATAVVHEAALIVGNDERWKAALARLDTMVTFCHLGSHVPL